MVVEFATSGIFNGYRRQSLSWPQEVAVGENEENVGGGGGGAVSRAPPALSSKTEGGRIHCAESSE